MADIDIEKLLSENGQSLEEVLSRMLGVPLKDDHAGSMRTILRARRDHLDALVSDPNRDLESILLALLASPTPGQGDANA